MNKKHLQVLQDQIDKYNVKWVQDIQRDFLPYMKIDICRIIALSGEEKCSQCNKQACYFNTCDKSMMCWNHAILEKSNKKFDK